MPASTTATAISPDTNTRILAVIFTRRVWAPWTQRCVIVPILIRATRRFAPHRSQLTAASIPMFSTGPDTFVHHAIRCCSASRSRSTLASSAASVHRQRNQLILASQTSTMGGRDLNAALIAASAGIALSHPSRLIQG